MWALRGRDRSGSFRVGTLVSLVCPACMHGWSEDVRGKAKLEALPVVSPPGPFDQ